MKRSDELPIRLLTPANISAQKFPIKVKGNQGVIDNDMMKPATKYARSVAMMILVMLWLFYVSPLLLC